MTKTERIIVAIGVLTVGILFILLKDKFIGISMTLAGGSCIAFGVVDLVNHRVAQSVVKLVSGLLLVVCGWVLVEGVLYILAGLSLVFGILAIYDKIKVGCGGVAFWRSVLFYALPVICICIGLLLLFQALMDVGVALIVSGVLLVLAGGALLANALLPE